MVGQRKLRELWKYQVEQHRRAERLRNKKESAENETDGVEMDNITSCNEDEQYEQQIIIKSNMIFFLSIFYIIKGLYFIQFKQLCMKL